MKSRTKKFMPAVIIAAVVLAIGGGVAAVGNQVSNSNANKTYSAYKANTQPGGPAPASATASGGQTAGELGGGGEVENGD